MNEQKIKKLKFQIEKFETQMLTEPDIEKSKQIQKTINNLTVEYQKLIKNNAN